MCTCGLLSERVSAIVACHQYHENKCSKFDASASPPSNHNLLDLRQVLSSHNNNKVLTKIAARKREWEPIMESVFRWLRTWFDHKEGNTWPTEDYPWLQWAMHYHSKSEYLFCKNSTMKGVAKKAKEWAVIISKQRKGFQGVRKRWWASMRDKVIGLSNRQFKATTQNEHVTL